MEVHPSVPVKTVSEFIAYAKANPGKLNMPSGGTGALIQDDGASTWLPYRGSAPALVNLLAGQVQVYFDVMPSSLEYIRTGKLRALVVTTATRSPALPDIPTIGEFLPGYESNTWHSVGLPKNTPTEIIDKLNKEINASLADPASRTRFAELGTTVIGVAGRVGEAHRRGNRKVGQSD